ncbi:MAG: tyrosine-type recombinase/integrase [Acidiferrobacter sp.]
MATIEKRTTAEGTSYRVKIRLRGQSVQTATFARLSDAKRWGEQTAAAMREGRHFATTEAKRHTLNDAIARYKAENLPRLKDAEVRAGQLTWWGRELGGYVLADLTPARISEAREKLARETIQGGGIRSDATINRYLAALSVVLATCAKSWEWLEISPMRRVEKRKEPRGRVRYLSDDERERLLGACRDHPDLYAAVMLALTTGARRMEIMSLSWGQVDLSRRVILLEDTKNGERRPLPIVGPALDILRERAKVRRLDTDLVFPGRTHPKQPVDLRTPWETALRRASIENFHWHDLRHTTASYLAMNGAGLQEIAAVLGHKTLAMVKRYAHLSHEHVAGVMEDMAGKIFGGSK